MKISSRFLSASILSILTAITMSHASAQGSEIPTIETDPWNNKQAKYMHHGLKLEEGAILPNIVYPYIPAGSVIDNLATPDIANAPNLGAVERIIVYLVKSFSRKTEEKKNTAGEDEETADMWTMATAFIVFGLLLSGFLTFQGVSQGKKGPGEAIMGYLTKIIVIVFMMVAVTPNIPGMLIGLTNYLTKGVDNWFGYQTAKGHQSVDDQNRSLWTIYQGKLNAGHAAAGELINAYAKSAGAIAGNDPYLRQVMAQFLWDMNHDPSVKTATGDPTSDTTGPFAGKSKLFKESWTAPNGVWQFIKEEKSTQQIMDLMTQYASSPMNIVINAQKKHLNNAFEKYDAEDRPGSEALKAAIAAAPHGIDISGFTAPSRVLRTYAYIAFVYLSISIWGMGFAALAWVIVYSMPEEWQLGNVLTSGFKAGLAVVLTGMLIAIYLSAGLVFTESKDKSMADTIARANQGVLGRSYDALTDTTSWKSGAEATWNFTKQVFGGGDTIANFASLFSSNLLEHFMLGALILSAPAQAALMIKGSNGVGESASKALTAGGLAGQGGINRFAGNQVHGTGATGSAATSTSVAQSASRRSIMAPNTSRGGTE